MKRRHCYYRRPPLSYNWAKLDSDITNRMNMFKTYLNSLPKNRSDYVTDLEIPEITLTPYVCTDLDDCCSLKSDSFLTDSLAQYDKSTLSTASSIPLSRAMTDSEIDYEFYKRYRNCNYTDSWEHLRDAAHRFPSDYMASLNRYMSQDTDVDEELRNREMRDAAELTESRRRYNKDWRSRLQRRFDEEVYVYSPDDPSLLELQDALQNLDMKNLKADLASIRSHRSRLRRRLPLNRTRHSDIPEITLTPYAWTDLNDCYSLRSNSLLTTVCGSTTNLPSTYSSMPLSRTMSDSDIDYAYYKRYWNYKYPDTWKYWRDSVYSYPSDYISSYNRYWYLDTDVDDALLNSELRYATNLAESRRWYNEEWRRRLQRRLDEDYYLYSPSDSSLLVLQDELRNLDAKAYRIKNLEADLASIRPRVRSRLAFNRLKRTLYDMHWW